MQWNPYLALDGRCKEAFKFYEKCLGGKIVAMIPYVDTLAKEHMPASTGARIMHARLVLGDQVLVGCDAHPEMPYDGIRGCDVAVQVETPGQRHESVVFEAVMDTVEVRRKSGQIRRRPLRLAGDKAHSNRRIRRWLARRKVQAVIARPDDQRARLDGRSGPFDSEQYRRRNVVERLIGRLKGCRRVATRYEKLAVNFLAMLKLALIALYLE
jgi:uncharacterized glyoxalase superfamily protein PhnB